MTAPDPAPDAQPAGGVRTASRRAYLLMVAAGSFATTFGQQRALGNYPILFHLKEHLHFGKEQVSEFFMWATFAWNLKPLAGVVTDAFPIRGSRRRIYMLLGGLVAGLSWVALDLARGTYGAFLAASIALNVGLVFASTAMGGLQVEAGQLFGMSGRVTSLRQVVMSIAQIVTPLLGGVLAERAFGLTAGIGAAVMFGLAALALRPFRETSITRFAGASDGDTAPRYRPTPAVWTGIAVLAAAGTASVLVRGMLNVGISLFALLGVFLLVLALATARVSNAVLKQAQRQLAQILVSRALWLAVVMLFLVYVVPGLNTALTYRQSDDLHFSKELIGRLASVEGATGVLFALVYAVICRRLTLHRLIILAIVTNAGGTLLFLVYNAATAYPIHAITGAVGVLSELALMDLAVRATPVGCEALGFSLMLSVRNFGIALSDVTGSKLMDQAHLSFATLVLINAATTAAVLAFVPLLPRALVLRKEGETA
ncbi:MAG TPA: MFS transporter [Polyangia bacterium]|nr:MFS transporter [Polyangia bacterium]